MWRTHGGLRSRKAGFDSRAGGSGSSTSSECDGFAHDSAKVGDQVQFLAGTSRISLTLEPDGQATGCKPVLVGSTPTGVSRGEAHSNAPPPGFSGKRLVPSGPRRACPVSGRSARRVPCRESVPGRDQVVVAQRIEHQAQNLGVTGSIPVHNTPRSAEDRLLWDAASVSTRGPEGDGRPDRSALVRTGASPATRRPGGCSAKRRPEARGFRHAPPPARERRRGRTLWGFGPAAPADANQIGRPAWLKRHSASSRVIAGRPVPRRLFSSIDSI